MGKWRTAQIREWVKPGWMTLHGKRVRRAGYWRRHVGRLVRILK